MNQDSYTIPTLARALKVSQTTILDLLRRGELKCTIVNGRVQISQAQVEDYLQRHTVREGHTRPRKRRPQRHS